MRDLRSYSGSAAEAEEVHDGLGKPNSFQGRKELFEMKLKSGTLVPEAVLSVSEVAATVNSRQQILHHRSMHIRQAKIATAITISQVLVIQP